MNIVNKMVVRVFPSLIHYNKGEVILYGNYND
nr:MAG TPA: hypothetical protein [Caudoviricetes sp.]